MTLYGIFQDNLSGAGSRLIAFSDNPEAVGIWLKLYLEYKGKGFSFRTIEDVYSVRVTPDGFVVGTKTATHVLAYNQDPKPPLIERTHLDALEHGSTVIKKV